MRILKQSTAANVMVLMVDSTDHVTGKTGLTLTITASKDGAAFASISPTVTERGDGWYNLALTTSHTDTLGDLAIHITATNADPSDFYAWVVVRHLADLAYPATTGRSLAVESDGMVYADAREWLGTAPNALQSGRVDGYTGAMAANVIAAAAINAGAITNAKFAAGAIDATAIAANAITSAKIATDAIGNAQIAAGAITSSEAPNLDAAVSTRATVTMLTDVHDTLDDVHNDLGLVKTKTDNLPSDPADESLLEAAIAGVQSDTDDIQTRLPAALVGGKMDSSVSALGTGVITDTTLDSTMNTYQAKTWLFDDDAQTKDRYVVVWFKNGMPIFTGITSPTIQVIKASDGTDLISSTSMTQIGSTGMYRYDEAANRIVGGSAYMAKVTAAIDSATRTWVQPVGRDSTS